MILRTPHVFPVIVDLVSLVVRMLKRKSQIWPHRLVNILALSERNLSMYRGLEQLKPALKCTLPSELQ